MCFLSVAAPPCLPRAVHPAVGTNRECQLAPAGFSNSRRHAPTDVTVGSKTMVSFRTEPAAAAARNAGRSATATAPPASRQNTMPLVSNEVPSCASSSRNASNNASIEHPDASVAASSTATARNRSSRQSRAQTSGAPCARHWSRNASTRCNNTPTAAPVTGAAAAKTHKRALSGSASNATIGMLQFTGS